jgi:NDP-sugar pyrophosphorylase family protein
MGAFEHYPPTDSEILTMKAMILAAGFGTRLRPLTDQVPKALVPVLNRPAIGWVIDYLKSHGATDIVVNAHHHYQQIVDYLREGLPFGVRIEVRVENRILGTGGGIRNALDFWNHESFVVINSDILTTLDLRRAYEDHRASGRLATLVLHNCGPYNQIELDGLGNIGRISRSGGVGKLAFTGIHVLNPELLYHIPDGRFSNIIDCYRQLIRSGCPVGSWMSEGHDWHDIGTIEGYMNANRAALGNDTWHVGVGCHLDSNVKLRDWAVLGKGCHLGEGVEIRRSILWEGVHVKKGRKIMDSIVTLFKEVDRDLHDEIY